MADRRIPNTVNDLEWIADVVAAADYARERGYDLTEYRDNAGRSVSLRARAPAAPAAQPEKGGRR
jgi:hypothetical protein